MDYWHGKIFSDNPKIKPQQAALKEEKVTSNLHDGIIGQKAKKCRCGRKTVETTRSNLRGHLMIRIPPRRSARAI